MSIQKKLNVNTEIRAREVRLIDVEGNQLGIVALTEALAQATSSSLDLVEISPGAQPPVCRIMDYGKYTFQQSKQKAAAKKKQRQMHVKEIKFRPTIEEGDFQVKLRNLIRFLSGGDKVKVTLRFRGREMAHQDLGMRIMQRLRTELADHGVIEQEPKLEGRQLVMVLAPKKQS